MHRKSPVLSSIGAQLLDSRPLQQAIQELRSVSAPVGVLEELLQKETHVPNRQSPEIPRKGGPGITRSDILIINKTSLAPYVGVSLSIMEKDTQDQRLGKPFVFTDLKSGLGVSKVIEQVFKLGGL